MFFEILTSGIGIFKIVRLMIRFITVYFKYLYGVISLILLTLLYYMIYRGSNVSGFSQFINYFFPTIYDKALGLFLFLLVIVSIIKYVLDPKTERFYEGLGDIYFDLGKRDYADKAYKMSLKHNSNRTYALQRLGDLNASFSDYDLSIEYYEKSLKINNRLFFSWVGLGNIYSIQSRTQNAIDAYETALKIRSMHEINLRLALLYKAEGASYIHQKLYDEAITSLEKSISNDPSLGASWELLGDIYAQKGKHDKAINAFEEAIKLISSSVLKDKLFSSLLIIGPQYYKDGDFERSKRAFQRATELNPQSVEAWSYMGNISFKQGNFLEAEKEYRTAISLDPSLASAYVGLANVLAQQGNFLEAEKEYRTAISLDPSLATAYVGLANVLAQQGNFLDAGKEYRTAISLDSSLASAYVGLANVLAQQGNFLAAEKEYRTAISLDASLASAYIGLANVLAQQQRYDQSLTNLGIAIECDANEAPKLKDMIDLVKYKSELDVLLLSSLRDEKNNVALLLDTSGSMQGQKISGAKEVIAKAIRLVPAKHNPINLIFFGASIYAYSLESDDTPKSRDTLINMIYNISADGRTPLLGALNRAWEFLERRENRIIIIVTDGIPNDALPGVILDYAKSLKTAGCRIISLGIGEGKEINKDFLDKIASIKEDFHLVDAKLDFVSPPYVYRFIYPLGSPQ